MSSHLEQRLDKLESLIEAHTTSPEDIMATSGKYLKWIQSVIAVFVVVIGMGITWGITQGKISSIEAEIKTIRETVSTTKVERDSLRADFITIQVKQAATDQLLSGIREDVAEIREDVKKLIRNR